MSTTLENLRCKHKSILRKMLKYAEKFRDSINDVIEAEKSVSILKECINSLWNYSPEIEPDFAKIIILLQHGISGRKWAVLNKYQVECIIDVINMCINKVITSKDQEKAFQLLYKNGVDPFPDIDIEDEDE